MKSKVWTLALLLILSALILSGYGPTPPAEVIEKVVTKIIPGIPGKETVVVEKLVTRIVEKEVTRVIREVVTATPVPTATATIATKHYDLLRRQEVADQNLGVTFLSREIRPRQPQVRDTAMRATSSHSRSARGYPEIAPREGEVASKARPGVLAHWAVTVPLERGSFAPFLRAKTEWPF